MANPEHLELVRKGADEISDWRSDHPGTRLDLRGANLRRADLNSADLTNADLTGANLEWADLRWADLMESDLTGATLKRADLHKADLYRAILRGVNLSLANLEDASLVSAVLDRAIFNRTTLINTDLSDAIATAVHEGPSPIDRETIAKSKNLPTEFLRGCGLYTAYQAVVYRVVIGSPSDVENERHLARDTIYTWNDDNAHRHNAVLLPVLWETHAVPELGDHPQQIINRQLIETSQILVCIFWTRIGTPTGKQKSGTIEEITKFMDARKPVLVYFCSRPLPQDHDPQQWNSLKAFKSKIRKRGLIAEFSTDKELRDMLTKHLTAVIENLTSGQA